LLPVTGQSRYFQPFFRAESEHATVESGSMVLIWIHVTPDESAARNPSGPSMTCRRAAGSVTMVMRKRTFEAASLGVEADRTPKAWAAAALDFVRL